MIGKLNDTHIEEVLTKNVIGRIGCSSDGHTYIVPISYAYDGQYVYAHTTEGRKIDIMRKNPNVCFEVDNTNDMANWQSILAWGKYEELDEIEERSNALKHLIRRVLPFNSSVTTHLCPNWPFHSDDEHQDVKGIVFRIHLQEKTGRFESTQVSPSFAG